MNKLILGALISSCWVNLACGMNYIPQVSQHPFQYGQNITPAQHISQQYWYVIPTNIPQIVDVPQINIVPNLLNSNNMPCMNPPINTYSPEFYTAPQRQAKSHQEQKMNNEQNVINDSPEIQVQPRIDISDNPKFWESMRNSMGTMINKYKSSNKKPIRGTKSCPLKEITSILKDVSTCNLQITSTNQAHISHRLTAAALIIWAFTGKAKNLPKWTQVTFRNVKNIVHNIASLNLTNITNSTNIKNSRQEKLTATRRYEPYVWALQWIYLYKFGHIEERFEWIAAEKINAFWNRSFNLPINGRGGQRRSGLPQLSQSK